MMKRITKIEICGNGLTKNTEVSLEDYSKQVKEALKKDRRLLGVREKI